MKSPVIPYALLLACLGLARTASAAEWYAAQPPAHPVVRVPSVAAAQHLSTAAEVLNLSGIELAPPSELQVLGGHTVRFEQRYHGLPVFGRKISVRVAPDGTIGTTMVDVARGLAAPSSPTVDEFHATSIAAASVGQGAGQRAKATLGVFAQRDRGGILVWQVDLMASGGMQRVLVDATQGVVFFRQPLARDALGRVYPIDPDSTPTLEDRELPNLTASTPQKLVGRAGSVFNFVSGDVEQSPQSLKTTQDVVPSSGDDFLYDPPAQEPDYSDSFSQVAAYYHIDRMDAYFRNSFAVPMGYKLMAVSNYAPGQQPFLNAFFTPWDTPPFDNAIFLGQADKDLGYDSDVLLHEFTHYVNYNAIGFSTGPIDFDQFGMVTMPGAIDEAVADYFSSSVNDDPIVGQYSLGTYARDLRDTSGVCPNDMIQESHEDGRIIGSTTWSLREAVGKELADQLVWSSLTLLPSSGSFGDFATGVLSTGDDLVTQGLLDAGGRQKVGQVITDRGLNDCGRTLKLEPQSVRTVNLLGLDMLAQLYYQATCSQIRAYHFMLTSTFLFEHVPNPTDKGARIRVHLDTWEGSDLDWNLYVRRGTPVTIKPGPQGMPTINAYDYAVEHILGSDADLLIDDTSDPKFDSATSYHILLTHENCATVTATVSSEPAEPTPDAGPEASPDAPDTEPEAAAPDAGGPDAAPAQSLTSPDYVPGGGCACETAPSGSTRPLWLGTAFGLLAGLVAVRRRR